MKQDDPTVPRLLVTVLFALWVMTFVYAFVSFRVTAPDDIGFTRGLNRIKAFLGWQGIAALLALCIFGVTRSWPQGSSVRRLGSVPLGLAGCLVAALGAVIAWAAVTG